jgi:hypothetical protein
MTRICASCGTEVDGEALFCPTCGQPMATGAEPELPAAPDWPAPPPRPAPEPVPAPDDAEDREVAETSGTPEHADPDDAPVGRSPVELPDQADDQPVTPASAQEQPAARATHGWDQPASEQPVPPWRRGAAFRSGEAPPRPSGEGEESSPSPAPSDSAGAPQAAAGPPGGPGGSSSPFELGGVVRMPTLLSDWCAGAGALLALVAMFLPWRVAGAYTTGWGFSSGVNLLYTLVLLAVLAIVFLPDLLPRIPQRALVLLSVGLVGAGVGLDRLGQPLTGAGGTLFLIAALGIALGGALAQLDYDRPVGGPQA